MWDHTVNPCEPGKYHVMCVEYAGSTSSVWVNGNRATSFTASTTTKRAGITIGNKMLNSPNTFFHGLLGTLEIYNDTVPNLIKTTIMEDLCRKYIKDER